VALAAVFGAVACTAARGGRSTAGGLRCGGVRAFIAAPPGVRACGPAPGASCVASRPLAWAFPYPLPGLAWGASRPARSAVLALGERDTLLTDAEVSVLRCGAAPYLCLGTALGPRARCCVCVSPRPLLCVCVCLSACLSVSPLHVQTSRPSKLHT